MEYTKQTIDEKTTLTFLIKDVFRERESSYLKKVIIDECAGIQKIHLVLEDIDDIDITAVQSCFSLREFCNRRNIAFTVNCRFTKASQFLLARCGLLDFMN